MRIALVEDHALTRGGLRTALTSAGFVVAVEANDGIVAENLIVQSDVSIAVVDLGLPGQDGIALTQALKQHRSDLGVVIVTMQETEEYIFSALAAGANAYCVKASDVNIIIDAVRAVATGSAYFDPRIAHVILGRFQQKNGTIASNVLTERELDVLRLIADGCGNVEIAQRLILGVGTVKGHIHDILEKLSASDRTHAAVIAFRKGWLI